MVTLKVHVLILPLLVLRATFTYFKVSQRSLGS